MRLVVIESPYAGTPEEVQRNLRYLRACMKDCLDRGEAPFASHGLYTQPGVLDDLVPAERDKGILAGFYVSRRLDARAFYMDLGESSGMHGARTDANEYRQPVEDRLLGGDWSVTDEDRIEAGWIASTRD